MFCWQQSGKNDSWSGRRGCSFLHPPPAPARIIASDFSVVIQGETGTGKTHLASLVHSVSRRADKPFIKVSIGSLQDSVVESELFGYEKGAFTGADRTRKGYFGMAEGGALSTTSTISLTSCRESSSPLSKTSGFSASAAQSRSA